MARFTLKDGTKIETHHIDEVNLILASMSLSTHAEQGEPELDDDSVRTAKHGGHNAVSPEERKRRREEWSDAYFATVQQNPYQTAKTEIMRDVLLALRNDEDPGEPTSSKVLKSTGRIRKQIALWRKRNPNGDISKLESIDELPEPDEPEDPESQRAS